jgi:hypothetical protein
VQLKRNDSALVLKVISGGMVDILTRQLDSPEFLAAALAAPDINVKRFFIRKAQDYVRQQARKLLGIGSAADRRGKSPACEEVAGQLAIREFPVEYFLLSRALRGHYKNPDSIKHKVLADRANARNTDSFQSNDRCG